MRTGRAHGAAIGDVLTGTLGTGVLERARSGMGACAKLLKLEALPFLKCLVADRAAAAVAHVEGSCGITPTGIIARFVGGLFKTAKS